MMGSVDLLAGLLLTRGKRLTFLRWPPSPPITVVRHLKAPDRRTTGTRSR